MVSVLTILISLDEGDQAVKMDMAIEGGAKAVDKGHGAETGTRWRAGAGLPKGRLARTQEDPKQGSERLGTMTQEPAQALGKRQDPLASRHPREHMLRKVSRRLGHAARVAARARTSSPATEGHQKVVAAAGATGARKALGKDPMCRTPSSRLHVLQLAPTHQAGTAPCDSHPCLRYCC